MNKRKREGSAAEMFADWAIQATCLHFGVSEEFLLGEARTKTITRARFIAIAVTRDLWPQLSFPELAKTFGDRDYTSIMNACRRVAKLRAEDALWRTDYDTVRTLTLKITPRERRPA